MARSFAAACLTVVVLATVSCDLLGPSKPESFTLVAADGMPLPYVESGGRNAVTGSIGECRREDGKLTLFAEGRFLWEGTVRCYVNGMPDPDLKPLHNHIVGPYSRSDSSFELSYIFGAVLLDGGHRLEVTDRTGAFNGAVFEFVR